MAELSRPIDKEFNVEVEGGRFSTKFLNDLVDTHVNKIAPRYVKFQKLYEGKHKIQNRPRKDKNKPNNKLVNDFFGQTIDNTVGYFLGNPIVLNYTEPKKDKAPVEADPADVGVDLTELEDTAVQDELDKICSDNDKDDLFIEWGKEAMIKGLSHILVYQDEESHTKMMRVSPEDLIIVYKNSSTKEPAYKIRLYDIDTEDTKKTTHYAEVYSPTKIETFKCVDDGSCATTGKGKARQFASYEFVEEKSHIFGRIPIITVYNNEEQMSDLEKIETLVNDYDKVLSDVSNEFEAFRNAYLMLKNLVAGNDSIQKLKDEGIVEVMENGDMKFITKEIQTEALENHLNRLEKNIHKFSAVPDLSDENFAGNLSGVAIRFKLFGLETKCIIKERKMEKAIKELVRVLSVPIHVNTGREVDVLKKTTHYAEVYSPTKIETFKCVDDGSCATTGKGKARQFASYEFVEEKSHIFGRIPIITVYNNEEQMSDLEKIETLVNDYDKVLSDVSNEFEAFRNAYLMLKNLVAGNDSIQKLKDEGIVEVMENGDMKFITKEIQTEALENHLNRLEKNIHKFSAVPDLSDENFAGNLSGVAIRFKLFGLETKCIIKERKMEKAIKELVRVLSVPIHVNTGREVDVLNLKVEFSRNVPNNLTEIVDTVTKLDGKVDKETLLSLLPFIDNPKEVLEKLEADKERDRQSTDPYSMQNVTEDSNNLFPNLNAQNSPQEALNAQGATIPQPEQ